VHIKLFGVEFLKVILGNKIFSEIQAMVTYGQQRVVRILLEGFLLDTQAPLIYSFASKEDSHSLQGWKFAAVIQLRGFAPSRDSDTSMQSLNEGLPRHLLSIFPWWR